MRGNGTHGYIFCKILCPGGGRRFRGFFFNASFAANNHATFTIQIQGRFRDYLWLLMGHPVFVGGKMNLKIVGGGE